MFSTSRKLRPAARTRISTSPGPGARRGVRARRQVTPVPPCGDGPVARLGLIARFRTGGSCRSRHETRRMTDAIPDGHLALAIGRQQLTDQRRRALGCPRRGIEVHPAIAQRRMLERHGLAEPQEGSLGKDDRGLGLADCFRAPGHDPQSARPRARSRAQRLYEMKRTGAARIVGRPDRIEPGTGLDIQPPEMNDTAVVRHVGDQPVEGLRAVRIDVLAVAAVRPACAAVITVHVPPSAASSCASAAPSPPRSASTSQRRPRAL